jgi:sugar phosphate isomerase/epimerase
MTPENKDLSRLCVHTITTKPLDFETACVKYAHYGIRGMSIWRDAVEGISPARVRKSLSDNGITPVSYVRGGFFPSVEAAKRQHAIQDNKKMIKEASDMQIPLLVLVCGSDPGQSLEISRNQIRESIEELLPEAEKLGVKLAIEPLHPMYADTRSAITSLSQANDMAEKLRSDFLGIAVDVYHLWFDEALEEEILRCGRNDNLYAFHICDWKVPTEHMLTDRGLMGEGCIPLKKISTWVEEAGFQGFAEVEIFSERHWARDQDEFLEDIVKAYRDHL